MGIYIKGMEMPQGENALLIGILPSGEVYSVFQDNETGELGLCKPKAEPVTAIPVPPHGRLIESKAFLQVAHETDDFSLDEFAHLAVLVAATPTIIEAEEV